jgi:hypothetical protein
MVRQVIYRFKISGDGAASATKNVHTTSPINTTNDFCDFRREDKLYKDVNIFGDAKRERSKIAG